jgi:hypothetical protein
LPKSKPPKKSSESGGRRKTWTPKLAERPTPVVELRVEAIELAEHTGTQLELVRPQGEVLGARLTEGLRQVRAGVGSGSVCAVVEVAPWSRIPETRALFVPRDE